MNCILVTERSEGESGDESDDQDYPPTVPKKCRRSLPATVVTKEIPEYYGGKRVGPWELPHVQNKGTDIALPCVVRGKKAPNTSINTCAWMDWL